MDWCGDFVSFQLESVGGDAEACIEVRVPSDKGTISPTIEAISAVDSDTVFELSLIVSRAFGTDSESKADARSRPGGAFCILRRCDGANETSSTGIWIEMRMGRGYKVSTPARTACKMTDCAMNRPITVSCSPVPHSGTRPPERLLGPVC